MYTFQNVTGILDCFVLTLPDIKNVKHQSNVKIVQSGPNTVFLHDLPAILNKMHQNQLKAIIKTALTCSTSRHVKHEARFASR